MSIPCINPETIHRNATSQSFARGKSYYQSGAVSTLTQRDTVVQAEVKGNEAEPYQVTVQFDTGGITATHCTCAYNFEGWCKHIVAVLLVCSHQPETIEVRPSLEQLLDRLDLNQTRQAIRALLANHPRLIDDLDDQIHLIHARSPVTPVLSSANPSPAPQAKAPQRPTVDSETFRRQTRKALRDAVNSWENGHDDDPVAEYLLEIVAKAEEFSQVGDGENAIAVLQGVTQGCVDNWEDVADYGADSDEIVGALDAAWTEAILTAELSPERQAELRSRLQEWQEQWESFPMSLTALEQGWDYPPLQRVFNGEITELGAWEGEAPDFADDLALIRLAILLRQERYQDYLYLAEAEGQTVQYLTMLARLGRIEEAMTAAQTQMSTMEEAFALAKMLRQQGAIEQALEIAQAGLTVSGTCLYDLGIWTGDLAEELDRPEIALTARFAAFEAKPSFQDYQKIEETAGKEWTTLRKDLLQILQNHTAWGMDEAKVDIFLYEGLIDRAIEIVNDLSYYYAPLIHRVMDAAVSQHPDWVIENARRRAEEIMDRGKADAYHHAVEWLSKAQIAYQQAGRLADWQTYYEQLRQSHARKYKLMAMLQKL
jgi:uncharacterized Zn finger protein